MRRVTFFIVAAMYAAAATPEINVEVSPTTYVAIAMRSDCASGELMHSPLKNSAILGAIAACGKKCKLVAVFKIVPQ